MKYRKRPVVIEAFQWTIDEVPMWWKIRSDLAIDVHTGEALIPTLEGLMRASIGDFIIKGVKGEIYPCKPDIFEATYERVYDDNVFEFNKLSKETPDDKGKKEEKDARD